MKSFCHDCQDYTVVFVLTPEGAHMGEHKCEKCGVVKGWLPYPEEPDSESEPIGA